MRVRDGKGEEANRKRQEVMETHVLYIIIMYMCIYIRI